MEIIYLTLMVIYFILYGKLSSSYKIKYYYKIHSKIKCFNCYKDVESDDSIFELDELKSPKVCNSCNRELRIDFLNKNKYYYYSIIKRFFLFYFPKYQYFFLLLFLVLTFLEIIMILISDLNILGYLTSIFLISYWLSSLINLYFINKITPTDD